MELGLDYRFNGPVDAQQLEGLFKAVGWIFNPKYRGHYLQGSYCYITCHRDGRLAGLLNCVSNGYSDGYLQDLMVDPALQGQGIAHQLMERMLTLLKEKGINNVSLIMSEDLVPFYQHQGFKIQYSGRIKLN